MGLSFQGDMIGRVRQVAAGGGVPRQRPPAARAGGAAAVRRVVAGGGAGLAAPAGRAAGRAPRADTAQRRRPLARPPEGRPLRKGAFTNYVTHFGISLCHVHRKIMLAA